MDNDYIASLRATAASVASNMNLLSAEKGDIVSSVSDQFDSINRDYATLVSLFSQIAAEDFDLEDTVLSISDQSLSVVSDKVDELLQSSGFSRNQIIALNNGYCRLGDALDYVGKSCCVYADATANSVNDALTASSLQLYDAAGTALTDVKASVISILDDVKSSLHASVSTGAAIAASVGETIADKYAIFSDKLGRVFSTNVDISGVSSYFKNMFSDKFENPFDFVNNIMSKLGINQQAQDNNFTPDQSEIYQFTGSSPLPAIDFHFIGDAFETIGQAIGNAVKTLFGGVVDGIAKVAGTVGSAFENVAYIGDLEQKALSKSNHTIENWFYSGYSNFPTDTRTYIGPSTDADGLAYANDKLESMKGKWVTRSNMFRQVAFNLSTTSGDNYFGETAYPRLYNRDMEIAIKPKLVDPAKFMSAVEIVNDCYDTVNPVIVCDLYDPPGQGDPTPYNKIIIQGEHTNDHTYYTFEILGALIAILQSMDNIYLDIENRSDDTDVLACQGLFIANAMANILDVTSMMPNPKNHCYTYPLEDKAPFNVNNYWVLNKVTNADLIYQCSGLIPGTLNPTFDIYSLTHTLKLDNINIVTNNWDNNRVCNGWIAISNIYSLYNAWISQFNTGSNLFVPYNVSTVNFRKGGYSIRTDEQNEKYAKNFLTTVVAAVIIVATAITALVILKRIQFKRRWKRAEYYGRCEAQTWDYDFTKDPPVVKSRKLTYKEKRRYDRYKRKDTIESAVETGLVDKVVSTYDAISKYNDDQSITSGEVWGENASFTQNTYDDVSSIKTKTSDLEEDVGDLNLRVSRLETLIKGES